MAREIVNRVHPTVVLMEIHSKLSTAHIWAVFPKPDQSCRMEGLNTEGAAVMIQKFCCFFADGAAKMLIFDLYDERHLPVYQFQHIL